MVQQIPTGSVYLETHYVRPFIPPYLGKTIWLGEDNLVKGTTTYYLGSPAIFAPYYLYTGSNLHITSVAAVGKSESQDLFRDYYVSLSNVVSAKKRVYTYRLDSFPTIGKKPVVDDETALIIGKTEPGKAVLVYSHQLSKRLVRERIDYGDVFTWLGYLLIGKSDPVTWSYGDKGGNYIIPVEKKELSQMYVVQ